MTPRQLGPYRLDELLGAGGMGEVFKAYDTRRDRFVALKLLPEAFSGDQEYLRRFQREAQVVARLAEPHVIPIHDFGEVDGQLFIDMRLVNGTDIGKLLTAGGRIAPQRAVALISQVAQALDAAHADNLVHRDIKPSNILVTANDFVYVVDFGIARTMGGPQTALTITGATIGTLNYMAPERFTEHSVDGRADVYALACVLHECVTGAPPFTNKDLPALLYAHLYTSPPPASLTDGVPQALDAVIARGMAKNPDDRFPTAGALAAAAREAMANEASTEPPTGPQPAAAGWFELPAPVWGAAAPAGPVADQPPPATAEPAAAAAAGAAAAAVPAARSGRESPTQTVFVGSFDNGDETPPPQNLASVTRLDPPGGSLPPPPAPVTERPSRGPSRRLIGLLILAGVVALALPLALILSSSNKPKHLSSAANTTTAHAAASAGPSGAASGGPSVTASAAVPTVVAQIKVGQTPSYVQVAPNGKFAYAANPGSGAVTVLDTATNRVSGTIKISQGPPQFVSFSPDSKTAYVSVYNTRGSVALIAFVDTATRAVTATVKADNHSPGPSTASPSGRYLYVPNHNTAMSGAGQNVIDVIDTAARKLVGDIPVPANPHWIVFGKNGQFYASNHMSGTVTVVDSHNNSIVRKIVVGETPHGEAISPDGSHLAVTSFDGNKVFVVDLATSKVVTIPVGRNPLGIAYSPDGRFLYAACNDANEVTAIDTAANRVIGTVATGKNPTSISVLPGGHQAYVSNEGSGTVAVLNLPH
jgi:serine/threonine-protein kinase